MCWYKRKMWRVGIIMVSMVLFLLLMVGVTASATSAHEKVLGLATPTIVQATPTQDTTVTALNKEKLRQEIQQLKNQNEPDSFGWLRTNASILLSTLVVVIGGLIGLWRWRVDQQKAQSRDLNDQLNEREKRAEERFQNVIEGFGNDNEGAKVGAAILLRTFLGSDYEQFYRQTYEFAVANLRLPRTPDQPKDSDTPLPLTTLSQTLITVFRESFPLNRDRLRQNPQFSGAEPVLFGNTYLSADELKNTWMPYLDASYVQLDHAYLSLADLRNAWMPQAKLRKADLWRADLSESNLRGADLRDAFVWGANLHEADLRGANLRGAYLRRVDLSNARLSGTDLGEADITRANLTGVDLGKIKNLVNTKMAGVKGLTKEQIEACKVKGAKIDEDPATTSQNTIQPSQTSTNNDGQTP